jgi:IS30 family transposase
MTLEDRTTIEASLNTRLTLGQIAKELGKANSTISREIRSHRIVSEKCGFGRIPNRCVHRMDCDVYDLCQSCKYDGNCVCRACNLCNFKCPSFEEEHCAKLREPPYVCNGCPEKTRCTLRKFVYDARYAHNEYRAVLVEAREGFNLTTSEVQKIDKTVSPLLKNGQSIHHIWVHHATELSVSERTIARLLEGGMLTASILDQQRKCGLKPRKAKPKEMKIDSKCRIGRTYG